MDDTCFIDVDDVAFSPRLPYPVLSFSVGKPLSECNVLFRSFGGNA